jgi:hypothetical protein
MEISVSCKSIEGNKRDPSKRNSGIFGDSLRSCHSVN